LEFLIVCPFAALAGFIDAVAGGGGLISIPAYLLAGLPVHAAIATNKMSSTMGIVVTTWRYAAHGYMVKELVVWGVICGLAGSTLGSNLALITGDAAFRIIMLAVIPIAGFYVLRNGDLAASAKNPLSNRATIVATAVIALCMGFYDGFYGPGAGTFMLLLLSGVARLGLNTAAGTTKAINTATNVAALVVFLVNGAVLLPLGFAAGTFNIAGNLLGSRRFMRKGSIIVRPVILVVLVLFACKLIEELFFAG